MFGCTRDECILLDQVLWSLIPRAGDLTFRAKNSGTPDSFMLQLLTVRRRHLGSGSAASRADASFVTLRRLGGKGAEATSNAARPVRRSCGSNRCAIDLTFGARTGVANLVRSASL